MRVGDLVRHTPRFLHATCWYTNVPIDGIVREVDEEILTVEWNDGHTSRVHIFNLERVPGKADHPNIRLSPVQKT